MRQKYQIVAAYYFFDALDDACDMPRKPSKSLLYGTQSLNKQSLSPPSDYNKQMNVYNKKLANAKKHCDEKKKGLDLLLSLFG